MNFAKGFWITIGIITALVVVIMACSLCTYVIT